MPYKHVVLGSKAFILFFTLCLIINLGLFSCCFAYWRQKVLHLCWHKQACYLMSFQHKIVKVTSNYSISASCLQCSSSVTAETKKQNLSYFPKLNQAVMLHSRIKVASYWTFICSKRVMIGKVLSLLCFVELH